MLFSTDFITFVNRKNYKDFIVLQTIGVNRKMISVVINTYNAEQHLAECLEAVKDFDEIVVCDMESTDNTVEIAKRYGCKVVTFPKGNITIVEPARQFAIDSASYPWVLVVDADEIITPQLRQYLYERIKTGDCAEGLYIARHNKVMGMYNKDWSNDCQLRFFKREGTVWPSYIHAVPEIKGRVERAPKKYEMLHLADVTTGQWINKMNQYTDNEVEKKSKRKFGIMALFLRPLWRFIFIFFFKGGFRNGKRGVLQAVQWAIYQQVLVSKIIEKRLRENL